MLVSELHKDICWEIGPGASTPWQLVLSPSLNPQLRAVVESAVKAGPNVLDWAFFPARRPKDWDYKVVLKDVGSEPVLIDATAWRFAMLRYSDGLGIFRHRHSPSPLGPHAGHGSESSGWIVGQPEVIRFGGSSMVGGNAPTVRAHSS